MLTEAERWTPGQLNVWRLAQPKRHYTICNELDLLLALEVALLQQPGTVAGRCGEEQSTAAGGGELGTT